LRTAEAATAALPEWAAFLAVCRGTGSGIAIDPSQQESARTSLQTSGSSEESQPAGLLNSSDSHQSESTCLQVDQAWLMSWVTSRRFRASLLPVCMSLAPLHRGAALHMLLGTTCFAEAMRLGRSQNYPGRSFVGYVNRPAASRRSSMSIAWRAIIRSYSRVSCIVGRTAPFGPRGCRHPAA
jgi:hypothetical protein